MDTMQSGIDHILVDISPRLFSFLNRSPVKTMSYFQDLEKQAMELKKHFFKGAHFLVGRLFCLFDPR